MEGKVPTPRTAAAVPAGLIRPTPVASRPSRARVPPRLRVRAQGDPVADLRGLGRRWPAGPDRVVAVLMDSATPTPTSQAQERDTDMGINGERAPKPGAQCERAVNITCRVSAHETLEARIAATFDRGWDPDEHDHLSVAEVSLAAARVRAPSSRCRPSSRRTARRSRRENRPRRESAGDSRLPRPPQARLGSGVRGRAVGTGLSGRRRPSLLAAGCPPREASVAPWPGGAWRRRRGPSTSVAGLSRALPGCATGGAPGPPARDYGPAGSSARVPARLPTVVSRCETTFDHGKFFPGSRISAV